MLRFVITELIQLHLCILMSYFPVAFFVCIVSDLKVKVYCEPQKSSGRQQAGSAGQKTTMLTYN